MAGIIRYGAYVPLYRLNREEIARTWGGRVAVPGERAVANFDEDSITMGVAAAMDCIGGIDQERIDGFHFATTTSPYREKQSASIAAAALNLRRDVFTADCTNSLTSGTSAIRAALDSVKAGTAGQALVAAADCRLGMPGSEFEQAFGDGAAALLFGDVGVAVEVEGMYSHYEAMTDVWRMQSDLFVKSWEDRFVFEEGYLRNMREAGYAVMSRYGLTANDFAKVVLYGADPRSLSRACAALGFDVKAQLQDPMFDRLGNTGSAFALMELVAALEEAKPGDRILLMSYGDGCDAFILRVTEEIENIRDRQQGMKGHLESKRALPRYGKFLVDRELLSVEVERVRPPITSSASTMWRDQKMTLSFCGSHCKSCDKITFPPQRVCLYCKTRDNWELVPLADRKGRLATFSLDRLAASLDPPEVVSAVDLEGGVRVYCKMTDRDPDKVEVDMPVDMTLRKFSEAGGFVNYFWKCRPLR